MKKIEKKLKYGWVVKTKISNLKVLSNKKVFVVIDMNSETNCIIIEFTTDKSFRVSQLSWACNININYKNKIIYLIESPDKKNES